MDMMEQLYMLEVFIDKITMFGKEEETSISNKRFLVRFDFGPVGFTIKEEQLALNPNPKDVIDSDEDGNKRFTRDIRVGKSLLFPSYPDMMIVDFGRCPLNILVWTTDKTEKPIFVGLGSAPWEPAFYDMIRATTKPCAKIEPVTVKLVEPLWAECCCKKCGEISFILRFSPFGDSIITKYQQLLKTPDIFIFQNNKVPSKFDCKRVDGTPGVCNGGLFYETAVKEDLDPDCVAKLTRKIDVCTQLKSCGLKGANGEDRRCDYAETVEPRNKVYPIDKIRMGNVRGPCGNTNCSLAHKVRNYIRNLETYKSAGEARLGVPKTNTQNTKNVCGTCACKEDRWHRGFCEPKKEKKPVESVCNDCGGLTTDDDTCRDRVTKYYNTGATPPDGRSFKSYTIKCLYKTVYDAFPYKNDAGKINYKLDDKLLDNDWPQRCGRAKCEKSGMSGASSCINFSSSYRSSVGTNEEKE